MMMWATWWVITEDFSGESGQEISFILYIIIIYWDVGILNPASRCRKKRSVWKFNWALDCKKHSINLMRFESTGWTSLKSKKYPFCVLSRLRLWGHPVKQRGSQKLWWSILFSINIEYRTLSNELRSYLDVRFYFIIRRSVFGVLRGITHCVREIAALSFCVIP